MGDGNIHFNLEQPVGVDRAWFLGQDHAIMDTVNEVVRQFDGSFSAEHGIGKLKPYMMPDWRGGAELEMMQRIKAAIDPLGIMNPARFCPAEARFKRLTAFSTMQTGITDHAWEYCRVTWGPSGESYGPVHEPDR